MKKSFIGRNNQLKALQIAYRKTCDDKACNVKFIRGQSGTGKTQLFNEFLHGIEEPAITMRAACFSQANLEEAYYPFKELLSSVVNTSDKDSTRSATSGKILLKITEELLGQASELASAFIPSWKLIQSVSTFALEETGVLESIKKKITGAATAAPENLDNNKIAEQIQSFLESSSKVTPMVIVIDDMQWMDQESVVLLQKLLTSLQDSRLFFILSYRSNQLNQGDIHESDPILILTKHIESLYDDTIIDLDHLDDTEEHAFTQAFLNHHTPGISSEFSAQFHSRTKGLPLYCLELLDILKEKNIVFQDETFQWQGTDIPFGEMSSAMSNVIAERIDKLDIKYRRWLDIACVQGNIFLTSTISEGAQVDESQLLYELSKILDRRLKLVEEIPPLCLNGKVILRYQFSHKLIQQYLYNELSQGEKHYLHREVAKSLESIFEDHLDEKFSIIAYHFNHAMQYEDAYKYYMKACQYQYKIGAYKSAVKLLKQLLSKLPYLADSAEPIRKEMNILALLSSCYIALYGYGSKEVGDIVQREQMIRRELNDDESMFHIVWKRWSNLILQGRLEESQQVIQKLHNISQGFSSKSVQKVEYYHAAGVTEFNSGNFPQAISLLEKGLKLFQPGKRETHLLNYGNDPELLLISWLIWSNLFNNKLERTNQLITKLDQAFENSQHPSSQAFALIFKAMYFVFKNQPEDCQKVLLQFYNNEKFQLPFWQAWAKVIGKWSSYHITQRYQSLEADITDFVNIGGKTWKPFFYALWGDIAQDFDEQLASRLFSKAINYANRSKSKFHVLPILATAKKFYATRDSKVTLKLELQAHNIIEKQQAFFWQKDFNLPELKDEHTLG